MGREKVTLIKKQHDSTCESVIESDCPEDCGCAMYNSDDDLKPFATVPGEEFPDVKPKEDRSAHRLLGQVIQDKYEYGQPAPGVLAGMLGCRLKPVKKSPPKKRKKKPPVDNPWD